MSLGLLLVLYSGLSQQVGDFTKDVFFSKNQMNFNLNRCYEQVLEQKDEDLKVVTSKLDLKVKYQCKTLLNYRSSLECKATVINKKKLSQASSFKPRWHKKQRKLSHITDDWTREVTWDKEGNVMEVTLISNGGTSNKQRICYGRAF